MKDEVKGFTREELREIRDRAEYLADVKGINPRWKRVFLKLADACDELDAMIARNTLHPQSGSIEEEPSKTNQTK